MEIFISLSGATQKQWDEMTKAEKDKYIKRHPTSKYAQRSFTVGKKKKPTNHLGAMPKKNKHNDKKLSRLAKHKDFPDLVDHTVHQLAKGKMGLDEAAQHMKKIGGGSFSDEDASDLMLRAAKNYKALTEDADYDGWAMDHEDEPEELVKVFKMDTKQFVKHFADGV